MGKLHENLWVGQSRNSRDVIVVFDPELQIPGQSHVNLFSLLSNTIMVFSRKLRNSLRPLTGEKRDSAVLRYVAWKEQHAQDFVSSSLTKLKGEKEALVLLHKNRVDGLGLPYQGTRDNHRAARRSTHCYACTELLDGTFDIACSACGWLICDSCASCGCGYRPK